MNKMTSVLLCSFLVLMGCAEEESVVSNVEPRPVVLTKPTQSSSIVEYSLPAIIEASNSRELSFNIGGQIVELAVKEGDDVKQGQVIASLNVRQLDNRLRSAEADLEAIKVQYNRAERLISSNAIAKNQFDQIRANLEKANATFDSAKKEREDALLVSPFDGVIASTHVKSLQTVSSGARVVTLDTFGDAEAVVNIPANIIAFEQQYQITDIRTYLDVLPNTALESTLVEVSTTADLRSQTYQAKYRFTPPDNLTVLPGMTAIVKANADFGQNKETGLLLPIAAVMSDSNGNYVWLYNEETQRVVKQSVSIADSVTNQVLILEGVSSADNIVAAGGAFLFDGMKVRIL